MMNCVFWTTNQINKIAMVITFRGINHTQFYVRTNGCNLGNYTNKLFYVQSCCPPCLLCNNMSLSVVVLLYVAFMYLLLVLCSF